MSRSPVEDWLAYRCALFQEHKYTARCLDIEMTSWNGDIAVLGVYTPAEGVIMCEQYVEGRDLTSDAVRAAFAGCTLLIVFNGLDHDLPKLRQAFPGAIPDVPVLDLFHVSRTLLGVNASLKTLETTYNIERLDARTHKRGIALRLWREAMRGNASSLQLLLEYNRQDTINLYPLAEQLMALARSRINP